MLQAEGRICDVSLMLQGRRLMQDMWCKFNVAGQKAHEWNEINEWNMCQTSNLSISLSTNQSVKLQGEFKFIYHCFLICIHLVKIGFPCFTRFPLNPWKISIRFPIAYQWLTKAPELLISVHSLLTHWITDADLQAGDALTGLDKYRGPMH